MIRIKVTNDKGEVVTDDEFPEMGTELTIADGELFIRRLGYAGEIELAKGNTIEIKL